MTCAYPLRPALHGAALVIGVSAALSWLAPTYIAPELSQRMLGLLLGAVVVVYSNDIPKALVSRARPRATAAQDQKARRFAGLSLVLGGIGYDVAWVFAPLDMAGLIGGGVLAFALVFAVRRCLRDCATDSST